jgi:hypothetical protein
LFQGLIKAALDLQQQRVANGTELENLPILEQLSEQQQEFAAANSL